MQPETAKKKLPTSQKPKTTNFSSKNPQIEETHSASSLVGSIIEKGFSSTSSSPSNSQNPSFISYPKPTVLPFPVARHRSHGPHWNPAHFEREFEEEDDKDETDYSPIAAFASPIMRKKKKGMDFSRWRNFVSQNDYDASKPNEKTKKISSATISSCPDAFEPSVVVKRAKSSSHVACQNGVELSEEKLGNIGEDTEMLMSNREGFDSTMEDIHAENVDRLKQMSMEEIADAQTEIIEKMNPAMVEMLKKRGREKLGNRKVVQCSEENGKKFGKDYVLSGMASQGTKSTAMAPLHDDSVSGGQVKGNSWKIWSERVEKVRELRFNLEGDVVNADSYEVSGGCKPEGVQVDVGNVAKRDFLRTEGDPAALGYSIKELIVLIRSMVPAQRSLALKVLDSILSKVLFNLLTNKGRLEDIVSCHVDWPAIWAYALGPEPELVLSLRMPVTYIL